MPYLFGHALPWKYISLGLLALAIVVSLLALIDRYGDARYDAGAADQNEAWRVAAEHLKRQSEQAAGVADRTADQRAAAYGEKAEALKERIDNAERAGLSPLDVLFGSVPDSDRSNRPSP